MSTSLCSNFSPLEAAKLLDNLVFANNKNFDNIIGNRFCPTESRDITLKFPTKPAGIRKRKIPEIERPELDAFKTALMSDLHAHYKLTFGKDGALSALWNSYRARR
ncbi:ATP-dependent DNA helicase sgs1 [Puccinia graminis f. sp. tritici]|uniref:ATP-dependent DNA helicase sgs1 n=1 Tax=Puccinia graminis f. sp. tritici TaxID=56615 RepID=A0A5B0Q1N2_PUCGR|nr:ATP-dependent DNA helicase sgs1 [Puccinia graminis f. sp. tritici]